MSMLSTFQRMLFPITALAEINSDRYDKGIELVRQFILCAANVDRNGFYDVYARTNLSHINQSILWDIARKAALEVECAKHDVATDYKNFNKLKQLCLTSVRYF